MSLDWLSNASVFSTSMIFREVRMGRLDPMRLFDDAFPCVNASHPRHTGQVNVGGFKSALLIISIVPHTHADIALSIPSLSDN